MKTDDMPKEHFRHAIDVLLNVTMAPTEWRRKNWIKSMAGRPVSRNEKAKLWQLVYHYRHQIDDQELVRYAARKCGYPMADMLLLVEDCEEKTK